jgi:hypothetical protein
MLYFSAMPPPLAFVADVFAIFQRVITPLFSFSAFTLPPGYCLMFFARFHTMIAAVFTRRIFTFFHFPMLISRYRR